MSCDNLIKKLKDYNETLKKWHNRINAEDMMLKAVVGNFNKDLTKILNDNEPTTEQQTNDKATELIPVVSGSALLNEIIDAREEIIKTNGIRFVGIHENKVKQVFAKYGIKYITPF